MEISNRDSSDTERIEDMDKDIDKLLAVPNETSRKLKAKKLEIYRMQDANQTAYSKVVFSPYCTLTAIICMI